MDDRALLYVLPVQHPQRKGGTARTFFEIGVTNGQNTVTLKRASTREDAFEFAHRFSKAAGLDSKETRQSVGQVERIAEMMMSFGKPCRPSEISEAIRVLHYPDHDEKKFMAIVNAKLNSCERMFRSEGEGKYSLTDEAKVLLEARREGRVPSRAEIWTGMALLPKSVREANRVSYPQEEAPEEEAPVLYQSHESDAQGNLFDCAPGYGEFTVGSLTPAGAARAKKEWLQTEEQRARLRLGIRHVARAKRVSLQLLSDTFSPQLRAFCYGDQRRVSARVVDEIALVLNVPVSTLTLETASRSELEYIAERVSEPQKLGGYDKELVAKLNDFDGGVAVGRRYERTEKRKGRDAVTNSSEFEYNSFDDVKEAVFDKFQNQDSTADAFFCPTHSDNDTPDLWTAGVHDASGTVTVKVTPSKREAAETANSLQGMLKESQQKTAPSQSISLAAAPQVDLGFEFQSGMYPQR